MTSHPSSPHSTSSLDRRSLLKGFGALGGAAAGMLGTAAVARADDISSPVTTAQESSRTAERVDFYGVHQSGIVTPRPATGMVVAFDVLATTRPELERLFRTLTERIAFLMQGGTPPRLDPKLPPADSGILGPVVVPDNLTVTVSVGASLFDERFGLAPKKPRHLTAMEQFPNDALDPDLCHGDLLLQFSSNTADTNIHALRDIVKNLPDLLLVRWKQEGSVPLIPARPGAKAESARNFLGFRDGSANPDSADTALMERIVWVKAGDEPHWAANGSYQVVRIIRNFVERWDRTPLLEQEEIFGRKKASGAPFGGHTEQDVPNYAADPKGRQTRLDAHIRLANPRTSATQANLILRRPFNYSNGISKSGQLEMGLLFIAYQADLEKGFITVQKRLNGEPLEEYIKPIGGGYFFALPGVSGPSDFLASALLAPGEPT
ncbi:MAG: deferrochelatase/peroxidase EfeB [Rhizobiales bacterium 24-66-13]|jgi:deferrochelatase/peroxidase EfeB|nr:MAG: deferrochelatase/peroxidase EfeB [Rhizobiales bacterium 24-66-13]OZB07120.1 MAG: deferrochelatase/peroxidase EfeB [Rhizobiales bacterium 39-66-18]HQS09904.1 iron uptake transporter deferrochelatase/peroxidase subunit [Xanthobacteraceae bacterium]HQS47291.1 iron uptake transporter deferrochelatase/peroxidase subunit [Xanthobacteraceae bacterium]